MLGEDRTPPHLVEAAKATRASPLGSSYITMPHGTNRATALDAAETMTRSVTAFDDRHGVQI